jgi:anti-sigma factor RsiW
MNHLTDEDLFRLIDGECSLEEQTAYKAHLAQCAQCNSVYSELFAIHLQLEKMPIETPSADFTERLMLQLEAAGQLQARTFKRPGYSFLWVFAALGVCLFLLALVITSGGTVTGVPVALNTGLGFSLDTSIISGLVANSMLLNVFLLVDAILALLLIDRAVLQPYFKKRLQRIA